MSNHDLNEVLVKASSVMMEQVAQPAFAARLIQHHGVPAEIANNPEHYYKAAAMYQEAVKAEQEAVKQASSNGKPSATDLLVGASKPNHQLKNAALSRCIEVTDDRDKFAGEIARFLAESNDDACNAASALAEIQLLSQNQ